MEFRNELDVVYLRLVVWNEWSLLGVSSYSCYR